MGAAVYLAKSKRSVAYTHPLAHPHAHRTDPVGAIHMTGCHAGCELSPVLSTQTMGQSSLVHAGAERLNEATYYTRVRRDWYKQTGFSGYICLASFAFILTPR